MPFNDGPGVNQLTLKDARLPARGLSPRAARCAEIEAHNERCERLWRIAWADTSNETIAQRIESKEQRNL